MIKLSFVNLMTLKFVYFLDILAPSYPDLNTMIPPTLTFQLRFFSNRSTIVDGVIGENT